MSDRHARSCDTCNRHLDTYYIDGRMTGGTWATMCHTCHRLYGVGFGMGKGQLFKWIKNTWTKVKG